jgi:hypothetical protein
MSSGKLAVFGRITLASCTAGMQDKYEDRMLGLASKLEVGRIEDNKSRSR